MFLEEFEETNWYVRKSKNGTEHQYCRTKKYVRLRCDSCDRDFVRPRGSMNPNRLNNNYFHVCSDCNVKRFAQKKSAEKKTIWDWPASSDRDISKL